MLRSKGFHKGINLGGWMSQCDYSKERLDNFITSSDIEQIARWGFDHVRIPIDYNILQNSDGTIKENGFARIEKAVAQCEKHGLKVILDLHKTAGFSFDRERQSAVSSTAENIRRCSIVSGKNSQDASAMTAITLYSSFSTKLRTSPTSTNGTLSQTSA